MGGNNKCIFDVKTIKFLSLNIFQLED